MIHKSISRLAAALLLASGSPLALAAAVSASTGPSVVINQTGSATLTLDVTGGVAAADFRATFGPEVTIAVGTAISDNSGGSAFQCTVPVANIVVCTGTPEDPNPTFTANVVVTVPVVAGPAAGTAAITFSNNTFADATLTEFPLPATAGSVPVISAPPDIQVSYSPAPGSTVTFPSGVALTTQNASITVNSTGSVGTATVDNCALSGAGASSFSIVTGSVTVPPSDTIDLSCTLPNSGGAATAVLTCRENDSNSTNVNQTWNLSCPQGTPVPGPGYSSVPAPGSLLECDGDAGTTETVSFVVTNNGNPGAGSGLDFACSAAGAGFSIQSGGTATGLAVGSSQTVTVACTVPAEGAPAATGTVTCTTNAATTPTYSLSSIAQTLPDPVPQPNVVPASSLWSKLALIGLLAGLGIAVVGFRRS